MMLVDSHCHLDLLDLSAGNQTLETVFTEAFDHQVRHFLSVGLDLMQSQKVIEIAERYSYVNASVGIHPTEKIPEKFSRQDYLLELEQLIRLGQHPKVAAIGETGLDFYHGKDNLKHTIPIQQERLRGHIHAAKQLRKPLIIHSRHARQETLDILRHENAKDIGGVLHCFTEDWEMAKQAIEMNFYISFSGIVTFKNALALQSVVQKMPLDRLLIETDSPYLAPVPYRGKSNRPAYVKYTAEKIAELRQDSLLNIAFHTTKNFFDLFCLADRSLYDNALEK